MCLSICVCLWYVYVLLDPLFDPYSHSGESCSLRFGLPPRILSLSWFFFLIAMGDMPFMPRARRLSFDTKALAHPSGADADVEIANIRTADRTGGEEKKEEQAKVGAAKEEVAGEGRGEEREESISMSKEEQGVTGAKEMKDMEQEEKEEALPSSQEAAREKKMRRREEGAASLSSEEDDSEEEEGDDHSVTLLSEG